jgi:hypothetical protein
LKPTLMGMFLGHSSLQSLSFFLVLYIQDSRRLPRQEQASRRCEKCSFLVIFIGSIFVFFHQLIFFLLLLFFRFLMKFPPLIFQREIYCSPCHFRDLWGQIPNFLFFYFKSDFNGLNFWHRTLCENE